MDLVVLCYETSSHFPRQEVYGLTRQLQTSAVSVPANIAEGQGRNSTKELINHLSISYGSLMELETHIQIAARLGYVNEHGVDLLMQRTSEVGRMLNGLMHDLNKKLTTAP